MLPRSRPDPDAPLAAARVAALLGTPSGGWVPPPEADGEGLQRERVDLPEPVVPDRGAAPPPHDSAESEGPAPNRPEAASSGPGAAAPVPVGKRGLRLALPPGSRLDPGRRGALALLLVVALAAAVTAVVVLRGRPHEVPAPVLEQAGSPLPGATPSAGAPPAGGAEVVVSVAGSVATPGLVRLPAGSRVDDAVRAAGGLVPGADPGLLNLARRLVDGEQVLVGVTPPPGEAAGGAGGAGGGSGSLLDLNAATAAELDALPGIGPVLAERIVAWRAENGRFASVDQLREVPGIGEAKYAELEDKVVV